MSYISLKIRMALQTIALLGGHVVTECAELMPKLRHALPGEKI